MKLTYDMLQLKVLTFNAVQENTYILYNELKECIIIDPGCYSDEEKATLKSFIEENKLIPKFPSSIPLSV